ncbi:MAG TPA: HEAT repeat domain-containing protein [Planctomycetota bacterium]|jgi:hypothetical protein
MKRSLIGLAAVLCFSAMAADVGPEVYAAAAKYTFGQSRKDIATIEEEIRNAKSDAYKPIEEKLIAAIKSADATPDAKRYLLRLLGIVASPKAVPALAECLKDQNTCHAARIALEPLPFPEAGAALRDALGQTKGNLLIGIVSSVGARRDAAAVSALKKLAEDADATVASASIFALGEVGTEEAAQVLNDLSGKVPPVLQRAVLRAQITCANELAKAGKGDKAATIYQALMDAKNPKAQRIAALKGVLGAMDREKAAKFIAEQLQGEDEGMRTATLAAYCASTDKALRDALAEKLPELKPAAQLALLGVLSEMPEVAARKGVLKVLQDSKDAQIRAAALDCLAVHGTGEDAGMLVKMAAASDDEGKIAKKVIERMRGAGVNEALTKMFEGADQASRAVILGAFAARRAESALPMLVKLMNGTDAATALEATKAIETLGTAAEVAPLAGVIASTSDENLRKAAESAAAAICTRVTDKEPCSKALVPALEQAKSTAGKMAILRLLPRVRSEAALGAIRLATQAKEAEVSEAAIRALTEWPELNAAPHLLELAKTTQNQTHAVLALRGCIRLAGLKDKPLPDRVSIYKGVLEAAKRADEKKQVIAGLGEVPAMEALELLQKCAADKELGDDAIRAMARVAKQAGPVFGDKGAKVLEELKATPGLSAELSKAIDEAIKATKNAGMADGYMVAWMLSGPYAKEGEDHTKLFDTVFPPEVKGGGAWRPYVVPPETKGPRVIPLDKIFGGNNCVAYMRAEIESEIPQEILLELGSDDGAKVWLDDKVVGGSNATRAMTEGSDKIKLKLEKGAHTLLVKITQGGGEWQAVLRLRSASGKGEAAGVSVRPK